MSKYSKAYHLVSLKKQNITGYASTKKKAVALALLQASRLSVSVEVRKRNGELLTICLNPEKFVSEEGDITWI